MPKPGRKRRKPPDEPPPASPRLEPIVVTRPQGWERVSIVTRHAIPLLSALWTDSVPVFLLLTMFNEALTIASIGTVGVAVSTRQEIPNPTPADEVAALATLVGIGAVGSVVLTALFGWTFALIVSISPLGLLDPELGWGALAIVLCALPGLRQQFRDDLRARLSEAHRQRRDRPLVFVHLLCAGAMFLLSGYAAALGHAGLVVLAFLVTGLFVVRDLFPDKARKLAPLTP